MLIPEIYQVIINIRTINHLLQDIQIHIILQLPWIPLIFLKGLLSLVLPSSLIEAQRLLVEDYVMGKTIELIEQSREFSFNQEMGFDYKLWLYFLLEHLKSLFESCSTGFDVLLLDIGCWEWAATLDWEFTDLAFLFKKLQKWQWTPSTRELLDESIFFCFHLEKNHQLEEHWNPILLLLRDFVSPNYYLLHLKHLFLPELPFIFCRRIPISRYSCNISNEFPGFFIEDTNFYNSSFDFLDGLILILALWDRYTGCSSYCDLTWKISWDLPNIARLAVLLTLWWKQILEKDVGRIKLNFYSLWG